MRQYLRLFVLILLTCSATFTANAASNSSSSKDKAQSQEVAEQHVMTQAEISEISDHMKDLTNKARSLKGERLAIIQLEVYNMNEKLRKVLKDAMDSENRDDKFLANQIQMQTEYYKFYLSYIEKKLDSTQADIEKASKEDRLLMQIPLNELRIGQAVLYSEQYQNYKWLEELGVDVEKKLADFTEQLKERANFASAALTYSLNHKNLLENQLEGLPASQTEQVNLEISYLQRDIDTYSNALNRLVDTAESLGVDTVELRHKLFVATGNVTQDLLSFAVLKSTLTSGFNQLSSWVVTNSPSMLFNIFMFVLIMGLARILAQIVHNILQKTVKAPHLKLSNLMQNFIVSMSTKVIFCVALLVALAQVGLDLTPVIAGLGVAGIVIGFALQDTLSNFASGMMLLFYRPFDEGDWIMAAGVEGKVSHVSLVNTTIRTFNNEMLLVPNSKIWMDVIINRTFEKVRRVDMTFGIGYSDSIPKAEQILHEILEKDERVLRTPAPTIKVASLGDNSVNLIMRPWVRTEHYTDVLWDCTREVKMRFDEEGINIPFPQRDVHLHIKSNEADLFKPNQHVNPDSTKG
ncbi:MAG: mechanosensitive ion channel domain-containing protein [Vibrio sp.]